MSKPFWASLSVDQKKLMNLIRKQNSLMKKALKPLAKPLVSKVRQVVPVDSGALKKSIGHREFAKSGKTAGIVVGPRTNYRMENPDGGEEKAPVKYAKFIDDREHWTEQALGKEEMEQLKQNIAAEIKSVIGGK